MAGVEDLAVELAGVEDLAFEPADVELLLVLPYCSCTHEQAPVLAGVLAEVLADVEDLAVEPADVELLVYMGNPSYTHEQAPVLAAAIAGVQADAHQLNGVEDLAAAIAGVQADAHQLNGVEDLAAAIAGVEDLAAVIAGVLAALSWPRPLVLCKGRAGKLAHGPAASAGPYGHKTTCIPSCAMLPKCPFSNPLLIWPMRVLPGCCDYPRANLKLRRLAPVFSGLHFWLYRDGFVCH